MNLRIFAITREGLLALALAVTALWTCVGMEKATRQQSDRDTAASMRELGRLRHLTGGENVSTPTRDPLPPFHTGHPYTS